MIEDKRKMLARAAFLAGVAGDGDSPPGDADHDTIQESMRVAFEAWWRRAGAAIAADIDETIKTRTGKHR